jgi:hypothetical protein
VGVQALPREDPAHGAGQRTGGRPMHRVQPSEAKLRRGVALCLHRAGEAREALPIALAGSSAQGASTIIGKLLQRALDYCFRLALKREAKIPA